MRKPLYILGQLNDGDIDWLDMGMHAHYRRLVTVSLGCCSILGRGVSHSRAERGTAAVGPG
jgi:hypothetical protein